MSTADPLIALPEGTFPLEFSDSARDALRGKKRPHDDLVALKYAFKPASVTTETPGVLEPAPSGVNGGRVLCFDMPSNKQPQVFDVREESGKPRECVLIWNEEQQTFTLHALPSTLHMTLNRTLSGQRANGAFPSAEPPAPPPKKAKRATTAGKGIARKQLPSAADLDPVLPSSEAPKKGKATKKKAAPKKAAPKKAAAKKKGGAPASSPVVGAGKIKSVEIIEDSDDDHDDLDEFADMLGDAMDEPMSEEEFEVEEEDDDELGGAQYAGYAGAQAEGDEEWI